MEKLDIKKANIQKFTNLIIILSKLLNKVEDKFLAQKLYGKIADTISAFINFYNCGPSCTTNVAQYYQQNLLNSIDNAMDYLEYLAHIFKNEITPLLVAQKNLLKLKLHVLQQTKIKHIESEITSKTAPVSNISVPTNNQLPKSNPKNKTRHFALDYDSNKGKILNFVKTFPNVRTKEIVDEFNSLSGRTVKRNLKELTDEGFLKKKSESGAVYYTCG